eukprot:scaffold51611_cov35-Tisochrysis_lutea.AAC.1
MRQHLSEQHLQNSITLPSLTPRVLGRAGSHQRRVVAAGALDDELAVLQLIDFADGAEGHLLWPSDRLVVG